MVYTCTYQSALGNILLAADEIGLTGLWFEGQKYFANTLPDETVSQEIPILTDAKSWLDMYFAGEEPKFTPALHLDWITIQTGCVEDFITDTLWTNDDLWRDCKKISTDTKG